MLQFASEFRQEPLLTPFNLSSTMPEMPPPVPSSTLYQLTSIAQEFDELANTCLLLLHLEVRKTRIFLFACFMYLNNLIWKINYS